MFPSIGEGFAGPDRDGCFFFAFGEDLEEEIGYAVVQLHVSAQHRMSEQELQDVVSKSCKTFRSALPS